MFGPPTKCTIKQSTSLIYKNNYSTFTMCVHQQRTHYSCGCTRGGQFLSQCFGKVQLYQREQKYEVCPDRKRVLYMLIPCPKHNGPRVNC